MKTVKINPNDGNIVIGVGGQVRVLDFADGFATLTLFEKGKEEGFLRLEFTDETPLPKPESNSMSLDVTLPRKSGGKE